MSPDAFASHHQVIVTMTNAGNNQDCGSDCFIPNIVTIPPGGTVTWENTDTAAHTAVSGTINAGPDGVWDSSLMMTGGSFSYTADTVGTYHYFCMIHPWMLGTVIVTDQGGVVPDSGEKTTSAYGTVVAEKSQYELRTGQSIYVKIFGTIENPGSSTGKVNIELTKPDGNKLSMSITKTSQGYYQTILPVGYENLGQHRVDVTYDNNHVGSITFSVVDKNQAKKDRAEEAAKAEQERIEQARIEQERIEQERIEQERIEQERIEQERIEQERIEQERIEQERIEQERIEQESTGNQPSLALSPIKKGMWIQYQVGINFDFPEVYYRASNEVMELTMLQGFYARQ
jgi:plastocyanin